MQSSPDLAHQLAGYVVSGIVVLVLIALAAGILRWGFRRGPK
jgi:hypothetical protein